jgi:biotin operon repressor
MMRLTSKKTFPLLLRALSKVSFTQTELSEELNISIGRVNKVIQWLIQKNIVIKEKGKYVIVKPNLLTDILSTQQSITKKRTYEVGHEHIIKHDALELCLLSLTPHHRAQKDTHSIHAVYNPEAIQYLDSLPRGEVLVHLYEYSTDHHAEDIRTIIDLKTTGHLSEANELAQNIWVTKQ